MSGLSMIDLIARLSPLRLSPNSAGTDECVRLLGDELPFVVHEFAADLDLNGWVVPRKWEVEEAKIFDRDGAVVYDGMHHPLAVIGYSQPFSGTVSAAELRRHLFYSDVFDDALIYHCDLYYKPFRKEWGFSVPRRLYDSLPEGEYRVELRTRFEDGTMKVLEYSLPGRTDHTIILNAHNCHAFCCNDDLSGVAVGVELMRRLSALRDRRFTYTLVIGPEHFGSVFYLSRLDERAVGRLRWGVFLEALGTTGPLALQRSFTGVSLIDRALTNALRHGGHDWRSEYFRKVIGNDETCWEAVGYAIPFPSLSRVPFPEYHTSRDGPELMNAERLEQAVARVLDAFDALERDCVMTPKFRGLVALSHPRYDLYKPFWDPSEKERRTISDMERRWNYLMDCLPRYFDGATRLLEIAERHDLPFRSVADYVEQFREKGLVELHPADVCDPPVRQLPPL